MDRADSVPSTPPINTSAIDDPQSAAKAPTDIPTRRRFLTVAAGGAAAALVTTAAADTARFTDAAVPISSPLLPTEASPDQALIAQVGHNNHVARKWKLGPVHTAYTPPVKGCEIDYQMFIEHLML
jgi:hypothetical protein